MKIELIRKPRYTGAPDEDCIWDLVVNGYVLGTYWYGKEKFYEDKYKWAEKQIKKRKPVLERNIKRLRAELIDLEDELLAISEQ